MLKVSTSGDFSKTTKFLTKAASKLETLELSKYGRAGVKALAQATPKDTGKTSESWEYKIENKKDSLTLSWYNTNKVNGVNIAIILQYGHATKNGTYVQGVDYINPALKPIFDEMANSIWKEISNL